MQYAFSYAPNKNDLPNLIKSNEKNILLEDS